MTNARITSDWINAMSDDISEAKAQENKPTMTVMVRQTFLYGPYPFTPEADFDTMGATADRDSFPGLRRSANRCFERAKAKRRSSPNSAKALARRSFTAAKATARWSSALRRISAKVRTLLN